MFVAGAAFPVPEPSGRLSAPRDTKPPEALVPAVMEPLRRRLTLANLVVYV
jgi:hypothetical protein